MDRRALLLRVLTAVVGIPLLVGAAWLGGWWWAMVVVILVGIAAVEFGRLMPTMNPLLLLVGCPALAVLVGYVITDRVAVWAAAAGNAVVLLAGVLPPVLAGDPHRAGWLSGSPTGMIVAWSYLGISVGVLARWGFQGAFAAIVWFFIVIWTNDIAGYFVGSLMGRHKLAPALSPGKTWEGAAAGLVAGIAAGAALATWLAISPVYAGLAAGIVTLAAQLGDLFESAVKRRAAVKDAGVIFPGHGGVLDRFDGVFAAAPVAYLLLHWWAP